MIRKEAWYFYRTIPRVRLCWELEEPNGPKTPRGGVVAACLAEIAVVQGLLEIKDTHRP